MSDPNGLTETLTLGRVMRHGRAQVTNDCTVSTNFPWKPSQYDTLSLVQRNYSGANLGTPVWNYPLRGCAKRRRHGPRLSTQTSASHG